MEKAVIETKAGFTGLGWTGAGLLFLNLPSPTLYEAGMKIQYELEDLKRKGYREQRETGGKIDFKSLEKAVKDYFSGKQADLSFPVDWGPYTEFQKKVLQRVYSIPRGQVVSYGQIAGEVGKPLAARAVGGAVGANRVLLVVPCHRVIAHDGTLGGFGGGLDWKRRLLQIEGITLG
ncbi:MAG: methylated-DNA--[protein]-cysteine S-methyltransferase [Bacillota bacterium]